MNYATKVLQIVSVVLAGVMVAAAQQPKQHPPERPDHDTEQHH